MANQVFGSTSARDSAQFGSTTQKLLDLGRHRALGLRELVRCVSPSPGSGLSGPRQWARMIAKERDDLDSASWVLATRSPTESQVLCMELTHLDGLVVKTSWIGESLRWIQDDHLAEVAWQTAEAWWGSGPRPR